MPNPTIGLPVTVNVTAHPAGAPEPYTIDWCLQGQPWQGNTVIDLPSASGSHDMTFNLIDNSGKGLRFKATADEAMWVRRGNKCPTAKGNGGQVVFGSVSQPDRLILTVNDDNTGNPHNLCYMLRFDPDGNNFDPDIRNGGTGPGRGTSSALTTAIGAFAGVVATFLFTEAATAMNFVIGAVIGAGIGLVAGLAFNSVGERSSE